MKACAFFRKEGREMRYNRTMDETDLFQLTGYFKILSDPTRVKILLLLSLSVPQFTLSYSKPQRFFVLLSRGADYRMLTSHPFDFLYGFSVNAAELIVALWPVYFALNQRSRKALHTTKTELKLITKAPIIGFNFKSNGRKNSPAAMGIPMIL